MKARVIVREQVKSFLESLAPEPRRKLWRGIKRLADDKGDIKRLDGKLAAFWRLRVDGMRVVYEQRSFSGERQIVCFFSDHRGTVYSVLEQLLSSSLIADLKNPAPEK